MPTDGTSAANVWIGDFGTSPIFVQLSDKPLLASFIHVECQSLPRNGEPRNYALGRFDSGRHTVYTQRYPDAGAGAKEIDRRSLPR